MNEWIWWALISGTWVLICWGWYLHRKTSKDLDGIMTMAKRAAEGMYVAGWLEAKANALNRIERGDNIVGEADIEMEMAKARFTHLWDQNTTEAE